MSGAKRTGWLRLFRRKPKPERRTLVVRIPDDKIEELARLDDAQLRAASSGPHRAADVALWLFLDPIRRAATKDLPVGSSWTVALDWSKLLQPALKLEIELPLPKEEPCPPPASPC